MPKLIPSLAGILLFSAAFAFAGCASLDDRYEKSIAAAAETDAGYASLDSALAASVVRLESLSREPGAPLAYLADVDAVSAPLRNAVESLAKARSSLTSRTERQLTAMQEEAAQLPPDAAKALAAKAGKLRSAHTAFDLAAARVADEADKGLVELADVRTAVGANATPEIVTLTKPSLDRAAGAFRVARGRIDDAKKTLAALRDIQPRPAQS